MPRDQPDTPQIKPFEYRVGVGGFPALGGMYRAGDPATIPPNKFHMLVNVRITPSGMRERPGLSLEFDTGVEECIDGLTEDSDGQGASLMLYPGAAPRAGNGTSDVNTVTFRAIFPDSSRDYSEFVFALVGPASPPPPAPSVVLALESTNIVVRSRPFLFRGQACAFAETDLHGEVVVALFGMNLPGRSFKAADDCVRGSSQDTGNVLCGPPTGPQRGESFPFQWPVGSAGVIAHFDNPFGNTTFWWPDSTTGTTGVVDQILALPERADQPINGDVGVSEALYFIAQQSVGLDIERLLVRWSGATQTNESVAIPDNLQVALGQQSYGPYLVSAGTNGAAEDWAAVRDADGNWDLIGGVGYVFGAGVGDYVSPDADILMRGLTWGGIGQVVGFGLFVDAGPTTKPFIFCHPQGATEFEAHPDDRSCSLFIGSAADPEVRHVIDAVVAGRRCYAIAVPLAGPEENQRRLYVGDFRTPLVMADGSDAQLSYGPGGLGNLDYPELWIQAVGNRVYVGGHFFSYDPAGEADNASHHGVYDVTDPEDIFVVYRVDDDAQPNDSILEGSVEERFSRGALPAIPNDDRGGQGFQVS